MQCIGLARAGASALMHAWARLVQPKMQPRLGAWAQVGTGLTGTSGLVFRPNPEQFTWTQNGQTQGGFAKVVAAKIPVLLGLCGTFHRILGL